MPASGVPFAVKRRSGLALQYVTFRGGRHHTWEAALDAKPHITCRELIDFIMGYQENELPPGERAAFERHLAACPPCQAYLDSYDKTVALAKESGADDPVPTEVPESLISAILAARRVNS